MELCGKTKREPLSSDQAPFGVASRGPKICGWRRMGYASSRANGFNCGRWGTPRNVRGGAAEIRHDPADLVAARSRD